MPTIIKAMLIPPLGGEAPLKHLATESKGLPTLLDYSLKGGPLLLLPTLLWMTYFSDAQLGCLEVDVILTLHY